MLIRERDQIETEEVSAAWFLRSADFQRGVDDVRVGRPARFDAYNYDQGGEALTNRLWAYEKGRQFATIAPASMPLRINGRVNFHALRLLVAAVNRGDITP
jgi:hypothetical protein